MRRTTIAEPREPGASPVPEPIGHRGAAAIAPENTLPSLLEAVDAGAGCVEFDVRLTADGIPVLLHDATLDRTTDARGPLTARSLASLSEIDAGAWFDPRFAGTRIPTLDEALDVLAGRARAVIELKVDRPGETALRDAVLDRLARRRTTPDPVFTSMDWDLLDGVAARVCRLEVALTVRRMDVRDPVREALARGARAVHPHRARVSRRLVARAHDAGLAVRPYTVNDDRQLAPLARAGVDAVFTDDPAWLVARRGRSCPEPDR